MQVEHCHKSSTSSSDCSSPSTAPLTPLVPANSSKVFDHTFVVYVGDCYGIEIPNTEFKVKAIIVKEPLVMESDKGCYQLYKVTIQLPAINFETGPFANSVYETNNPVSEPIDEVVGLFLPPPQNGGYLYTKGGFLPKELRPNELMTRAYFGPCNNGQNIPFHYVQNVIQPPVSGAITFTAPISGYILRVTNTGGIVLEGTGTMGNIIPPGTQQMLPTTITYIAKPNLRLGDNTRISTGAINVVQYTYPPPTAGNVDYVRDHHINDAFGNVVAYAWADNSNIINAAANPNIMNLAYAIGKVKDGKLKMKKAQFLTNYNSGYLFVWDTSIAINRTNPRNIVVSYLIIDNNSPDDGLPFSVLYAAVSFDGGKTWPINGPTNVQPTGFVVPGVPGGAGDNTGVKADKFGNFWYVSSNFFDDLGNEINVPFIMVSSDMGQSWTLVYTFPYDYSNPTTLYDYPAFQFGGDDQGNYGVYIVADYFPNFLTQSDGYPSIAFIPISGLGQYNVAGVQQAALPAQLNVNFTASITASDDGRVWTYGSAAGLSPASYPFPGGLTNNRVVFKSPGPINQNYAGPWGVIRYNSLEDSIYYPVWQAAPIFGFFQSAQTNFYDNKRQALYVILNATYPELSQNSRIYLLISRDNGSTWSNPIDINTDDQYNRGFPSMALDTKTGNLLFGWYDCRDYKGGLSFNYYGAVVDAKTLDQLVEQIPLSNPTYTIPASGYDIVPNIDNLKVSKTGKTNNANKHRGPGRLQQRLIMLKSKQNKR